MTGDGMRVTRTFLASFLVLFLEIALIRWMPAYIRLLSYFSNFILLASFLGIGVIPPMPSWGTMIAESLAAMRTYPLLLFWPCAALALTLLAFTYVGDALRDALDPLMKR